MTHISAQYPATFKGKMMRAFWTAYTPLHPYVRDLALKLHIVDQKQFLDTKGRQPFLIGMIAASSSVERVVERLLEKDYGNNSFAWHDNGEIVSLRLPDGLEHQYHVRIFSDGEVRGHYELTPEAHPWKHYREEGMEERRDYFRDLLGDTVIYKY